MIDMRHGNQDRRISVLIELQNERSIKISTKKGGFDKERKEEYLDQWLPMINGSFRKSAGLDHILVTDKGRIVGLKEI